MASDRPPDSVEIAGIPGPAETPKPPAQGRAWLGVFFKCCHVYSRLYRNAAGTAYTGRCPRCSNTVSARVGPGGTTRRLFFAE